MHEQLNVCLLSDAFPPMIDGVSNTVLNYAKIIHESYGSVVVVAPRYPGDFAEYPFPVVRYPSVKTPITPDYRMGLPIPGIVREIRKHPVDIIHCHCPFVSSVIAKTLRQFIHAPAIFTYHTKYDIDIANILDSGLAQVVAKKLIVSNIEWCDEVWTVSRGSGENLKSLGYGGGYRIMVNGVDFPKERAGEDKRREIGSEHGLQPGVPLFLYVGRMMWYKGIRLILDGLLKVKESGVGFKMIFVGGGEDFDGIAQLVRSHGLENECILTGPIPDREKLRAYYSRADMFLFPSTFDSAPIAVREAAACGLASVLVRGSTAAEPVTDGKDAVLIDEDPDSFARAIVDLTKNPPAMKTLGENAMESLYMPWGAAVKKACERYREVLIENKK